MKNINITKGQIAKYALLPQVAPRINKLFFSGFANLAYFLALVYRAVNILPDGHVYLERSSVGRYSIRNVFSEAASHINFGLHNLDKIIIFFALIAGIIILFFQFFILATAIIINPASAQGITGLGIPLADFFVTPNPREDLALRMLDSVFGVPDIFGSMDSAAVPSSFHTALHGLFQIYSFALLVIAAIILAYFVFAVLAETAQTGTPFGKRYNHIWAPIRLVVGIGMLVPITLGLNAGQWITLYAAKLGSGFATQGWILFDSQVNGEYIENEEMIAVPETPNLKDLMAFMMLAHGCKIGFEAKYGTSLPGGIDMYVIAPDRIGQQAMDAPQNFYDVTAFVGPTKPIIRFGWRNPANNSDAVGGVEPLCGDLVIQNTEDTAALQAAGAGSGVGGWLNYRFYTIVYEIWNRQNPAYGQVVEVAEDIMAKALGNEQLPPPDAAIKKVLTDAAESYTDISILFAAGIARTQIEDDTEAARYGWGGASLWYNQIADNNGQLTSAAINSPQVKSYPDPMEETCAANDAENSNTTQIECYSPNLSSGMKIDYNSEVYAPIADGLSMIFNYWYRDTDDKTGNAFIDVVNVVLGLQGLFDMCRNADIHPLAQLSTLGKGMVDAAIRNLGLAAGSGAAGILSAYFGPMLNAASSFFSTVASIGILIGFILFYIVPFLPFLYFMFAMGGWVKGIFEAMVGVPLWALAHLRIDGDGLPGEAAINGYFLVFEIFIRPLLILFGFIASIIIFAAMVKVLNQNFTLIVSNLAGFNGIENEGGNDCGSLNANGREAGSRDWMRGPVDEFFFTVLYAIVVYMTAMSSFKLIDQVPNNILRWMGQGLQTFNDQSGDPAQGLISKIAIGGSMMSQNLQIAGNLRDIAGNTKQGFQQLAKENPGQTQGQ